MSERHVVVVGGGIAGLTAAHALVHQPDAPRVTVIERDDGLGGKIRTTAFAGHSGIDEGPDAFLARVPHATALARLLGLGHDLTSPAVGRANVWWDRMYAIPEGLLLGMPTDVFALARSGLIPWSGKLRAATEPFRRRTALDDDSLGHYVRQRFGDAVHLRLVDPLVGSIYAADTDHFSLAAVPQIADLAGKARSVLLAARKRPPATTGPVFYAPRGGMGQLVDTLAAAVTNGGGDIRTATAAESIERDGASWRINDTLADAVVLASPATATAALIGATAPDAAGLLRAIPTADVVLITMAVPAADWPEQLAGLSGYLVPKPQQRLVTAVSFGSQKWAHWALPHHQLLRISLGRDGLPVMHLSDEQLIDAATTEVGKHLGIDLQPSAIRVSRWTGAFPQYRPHHAARVAEAERQLPAGLALAGASYHGIGIPACVASATRAVQGLSFRAEK